MDKVAPIALSGMNSWDAIVEFPMENSYAMSLPYFSTGILKNGLASKRVKEFVCIQVGSTFCVKI